MPPIFNHERLQVYQDSISFVAWADEAIRQIQGNANIRDQLNRASSSICLNIAEGNGKTTVRDRYRYFDVARGSALECAACLDVLVAKGLLGSESAGKGKAMLYPIVVMLAGMMKKEAEGVSEAEVGYGELAGLKD